MRFAGEVEKEFWVEQFNSVILWFKRGLFLISLSCLCNSLKIKLQSSTNACMNIVSSFYLNLLMREESMIDSSMPSGF